jgi:hypothetical protein
VIEKALKPSKKFISGKSGLSLMEKDCAVKVKTSRGKSPSTSMGVGGAGKAPKALDLFGSSSSASDDEVAVPVPCQNHLQKSAPPKTVQKSIDVPTTGGTLAQSFALRLSYNCCI